MRSVFVLAAVWLALQPAVSFSSTPDHHHGPRATPTPAAAPSGTPSDARGAVPPNLPNHLQCLDNTHQIMAYNNSQVINWESSTQDQYHDRGMVTGTITALYPNQTGHTHFAISLGDGEAIEIIYNDEFGALPRLSLGMTVSACGDYITVGPHAQLPSPQPAIIHWTHVNPGNRDGGRHPNGFLIINNQPYGLDAEQGSSNN